MAFHDAYATLFSGNGNRIDIDFVSLIFHERALKKGGILHQIALSELDGTSAVGSGNESDDPYASIDEEECAYGRGDSDKRVANAFDLD